MELPASTAIDDDAQIISNPPKNIETDNQTRVSQVTTGTAGGGIIGGRNQQARQRQQRQQGGNNH